MSISRNSILTSPGFLTTLSLLIVNDFYLKSAFGGRITGKLSDFAGLFAFTLFWLAMFPQFGGRICVALAGFFAVWKSSYSQPLLDLWNQIGIVRISRTVDLTDLIALTVVPIAYYYGTWIRREVRVSIRTVALITVVSIFAFTATSYRTKYDYENKYYFQMSETEVYHKIDELHLTYFDFPLTTGERQSGNLDLEIPSSICFGFIRAYVEVQEVNKQVVLSLKHLEHRCPEGSGDRQKLLEEFEREFIERLKSGTPQPRHYEPSNNQNLTRPAVRSRVLLPTWFGRVVRTF